MIFLFCSDFLADLYIHGESTYVIEDENQLKAVPVKRTQYHLSLEALCSRNLKFHDNWKLRICQKKVDMMLLLVVIQDSLFLLATGLFQCYFIRPTPPYNIIIMSLGLDTRDNMRIN